MLRLTEENNAKPPSIKRQDILDAFSSFLSKHGLEVLLFLKADLVKQLKGWKPSDEALKLYPFLKEYDKFVINYVSCLAFNVGEGFVDIYIDGAKLKGFGYPEDFAVKIEHGGVGVPIVRHFDYTLMDDLMMSMGEEMADEVAQVINKAL